MSVAIRSRATQVQTDLVGGPRVPKSDQLLEETYGPSMNLGRQMGCRPPGDCDDQEVVREIRGQFKGIVSRQCCHSTLCLMACASRRSEAGSNDRLTDRTIG